MALAVLPPPNTEAELRALQLLRQLEDHQLQENALVELNHRVEQFEQQFGFPSEEAARAISTGHLTESHEVCQWMLDYKLLLRLGAR